MAVMNLTLYQLLSALGALVYFVAKWTGVILARRSAAKLSWGLMITGLLVYTLISILSLLTPLFHAALVSRLGATQWLWIVSQFGNVMFATGFALYALQAARGANRLSELEQLTNAMSEEITRLKDNRAAT
jgi:hypothetical protein